MQQNASSEPRKSRSSSSSRSPALLLFLTAFAAVASVLAPAALPAGFLLAIDPLTAAAIGLAALQAGRGLFGGGDGGGDDPNAELRARLAQRQLALSEKAFKQKAPLRNIGLGSVGRFLAGQEAPTAFTGRRTDPSADPFGVLGRMFGGLRVRPGAGSFLFPGAGAGGDPMGALANLGPGPDEPLSLTLEELRRLSPEQIEQLPADILERFRDELFNRF